MRSAPGLAVALLLGGGRPAPAAEVVLDAARGTFEVRSAGIACGPFHIEARRDGRMLSTLGVAARTVRSEGGTSEARFALAGVEVAVTLSSAAGAPTVEVSVRGVDSYTLVLPEPALAALAPGARVLAEAATSWDVPWVGERSKAPEAEGVAAIYLPERDLSIAVAARSVATRSGLVALSPGSETVTIAVAPGPNRALEALGGETGPPPAAPPWGWVSWYAVGPAVSAATMAAAIPALGAIDAGRDEAVVLLDDGWQDRVGDWNANEKFPDGLAAVAAATHAHGLRAGLWLAPFGAAEGSRVAVDHPQWLMRGRDGAPEAIETRAVWGGRIFRLDPSVPGVREHLARLAARATRTWGFDVLKLDFLYWGLIGEDRASFGRALAAVRGAARPGTRILLSGMPLALAAGAGDAVRTGPDAFPDLGHHRAALRAAARRAWRNRGGPWADADALLVRSGLVAGEARLRAVFQAMVGGPVFLGDPFFWDPRFRLGLATRLLPPHPFRGRPLDLFTSDVPSVWELPGAGGVTLHAALNLDEKQAVRTLEVASRSEPRYLYDVLADRGIGIFHGALPVTVAPIDAGMWASVAVPDRPLALATDAHVAGRAMNVAEETWAEPELRLCLRGQPHSRLGVRVLVPDGYAAVASSAGAIGLRDDGLTELDVDLDTRGEALATVGFAAVPAREQPAGGDVTAVAGAAVAASGSLGAAYADLLGLPRADLGGVRALVPPDDLPLRSGARLGLAAHVVFMDRAEPRLRALVAEAKRLRGLAREALSLDGAWQFRTDARAPWESIRVPSSWEEAGHAGHDGEAWYRTSVRVPRSWDGLDLVLELDGVDDEDWTQVNGRAAGDTHVWSERRVYRLRAAGLEPGGALEIEVRVVDHGGPGGIVGSVRLWPDPEAIRERLGGDFVAFVGDPR